MTSKKKKKKKNGRYIPKPVSDAVKEKHFFQCAWCCENLTERHHIKEYSVGGKHTEENLILLCPNCHTDVHKNKIDKDELVSRKSTHLKNDRISGGLRINSDELKILAANNLFINTERVLVFDDTDILTIKLENNSALISTRLYDSNGNLYFWMSRNRYWASSNLEIRSGIDFLEIKDENNSNLIQINLDGDVIKVSANFSFQKNNFSIPVNNTIGNTLVNCAIGIRFKRKN